MDLGKRISEFEEGSGKPFGLRDVESHQAVFDYGIREAQYFGLVGVIPRKGSSVTDGKTKHCLEQLWVMWKCY